jgi:molybdate transport system permease protein
MSARFGALCLLFALSVFALLAVFGMPSFAQAAPQSDEAMAETEPGAQAKVSVEVSRTGTEARILGRDFGITGFERLNKGTNKAYNGKDFGYRYPVSSADAFVVIVRDEKNVLVYVPAASNLLVDGAQQSHADFEALLKALDARVSNGGVMLSTLDSRYEYTSERSVTRDGYRYDFAVEVEPKHYYASITQIVQEPGDDNLPPASASASASASAPDKAPNNAAGALFAEAGLIAPASEIVIEQETTGLAALGEFLTRLDLRPFWVSLKTSAVAMFFVFILGLLAAWYSQRIGTRLKGILDSLFTIPMVLPPTVCGFLLLVMFGNSTALGRWLLAHDITLIFSWPAAVLAAVVVSFPLMYRTARGAFEGLDPNLADAARTLGWGEGRILLKLTIPLAWPSIAAGTVLAFARAMGEFGATLFVAGNYPGITQTMPIAIYFEWMGGHSDVATFWVFVVILFSFVVILFVNWYAAHTQRYRRASSDKQEGMRRGSGSHGSQGGAHDAPQRVKGTYNSTHQTPRAKGSTPMRRP